MFNDVFDDVYVAENIAHVHTKTIRSQLIAMVCFAFVNMAINIYDNFLR